MVRIAKSVALVKRITKSLPQTPLGAACEGIHKGRLRNGPLATLCHFTGPQIAKENVRRWIMGLDHDRTSGLA